ncbi:hypothetical protein [Azospirillum doebereinerae]
MQYAGKEEMFAVGGAVPVIGGIGPGTPASTNRRTQARETRDFICFSHLRWRPR